MKTRSSFRWAALLVGAVCGASGPGLAGLADSQGREGTGASALGEAWFSFDPKSDPNADSPIDLRFLNERYAGEHGFIGAKDGQFVHKGDGQPVRFWAVNGPARGDGDRAELRRTARLLAKYGVNLIRRHGAVFDRDGELDSGAVSRLIATAISSATTRVTTPPGRSAMATRIRIGAPCASTRRTRENPASSCIRSWTRTTTGNPR